jgi:hypothetical protein
MGGRKKVSPDVVIGKELLALFFENFRLVRRGPIKQKKC